VKKQVVIDDRANKELSDFPDEVQFAFTGLFRQLGTYGQLSEPEAKKMSGQKNLFEVRIRLLGQWRAFYCYLKNDQIIILHATQKKTQKTEKRNIETTLKRMKDYLA